MASVRLFVGYAGYVGCAEFPPCTGYAGYVEAPGYPGGGAPAAGCRGALTESPSSMAPYICTQHTARVSGTARTRDERLHVVTGACVRARSRGFNGRGRKGSVAEGVGR